MSTITLYSADCRGVENNCSYPYQAIITDEQSLREAVRHDYVCVAYKNGYRSTANFIASTCLGLDCDNDHSDKLGDWITPEHIREQFPDVPFGVHYSRHHLKPKRGKAPRPKFHVLFLIKEVTGHAEYSDLKKRMNAIFPYFDTKALDAARFFFGTDTPDVAFFPGTVTLNECLDMYYPDFDADSFQNMLSPQGSIIPEGSRNATLSHFAGRVLKRYGDTEKTYALFLEEAEKCNPPLSDAELSTIWHSAQGFYSRISQQDGYIPPEEYYADGDDAYLYKPDDDSDVGEARTLTKVFSDRLRYSPATDFIFYNGVVWEESIPMAHAVMHDLSDMQLEEASRAAAFAWRKLERNGAAEILKKIPNKRKAIASLSAEQDAAYRVYAEAASYVKLAMQYRESKNIRYVLNEAPPMLLIRPQDLDANPFLLNTPDCTYDLRLGLEGTGPHQADHFITKMTSVSPGEKGRQSWLDALNTLFCDDQELIRYVQMVAGMAAVGKVFVEALIIAYGDGRNGKSTFWNVLARVLGSYSGNISADALTVGCRRNIKPELAEAKGKRLLIASELEEGTRLNTSTVKQLCSTDEVYAEKKYKAPFSYIPSHTLVLYTNHLPKVGATDAGIWRRLIVIPFQAKIEGKSDIKNYADYLYEHAGEAILSWIIEGAQQVIRQDFQIALPGVVQKAVSDYREENDWLGHFLNDMCEVGNGLEAKSGELYSAYRSFSASAGEYIRSTTDFYAALEAEGFLRQKLRSGVVVKGLKLNPISDNPRDDFPDFLR